MGLICIPVSGKIWPPRFHSLHWMIALSVGAFKTALIQLDCAKKFISFSPVSPELMRPNYVQLASISTLVSLAIFARRWHC